MKEIAVLMTCFNRKEKTLFCLKSLFKNRIPVDYCIKVYLVDDASTDGTSAAVSEIYPQIVIIKGTGDLYWNRGMHLAWETAAKIRKFDYFLWLNDDTELKYNAIKKLLQTSTFFNDQSIIVGSTESIKNANIVTYGGRDKYFKLIYPSGSKPIEATTFNGNIVLIPNYVYEIVGKNDPFFHHSLGDFDYGLRATRLGIRTYISSGTFGFCEDHDSLPTWCNPRKTFIQRYKSFRTPLGQNPEEFFVFEKRHAGFMVAIFYYFSNHLRLLCPRFWKQKGGK